MLENTWLRRGAAIMKRIRKKSRLNAGGLTDGQLEVLQIGFAFDSEDPGFDSPEALKAAWFKHRERLLQECAPLSRPHAFWVVEGGGSCPQMSEQPDYLLQLRMELKP